MVHSQLNKVQRMGRRTAMADEITDSKSQLVKEICSISSLFVSCTHRRRVGRKTAFVDWYLILKVEEDSSADVIRKRYRQLALQLHPDKNKHPKADVAFKLVSEAYACLSDKAKRRAFNLERRNYFCTQCSNKTQTETVENAAEKKRNCNKTTEQVRLSYNRLLQAWREARRKLEEEARVIENCLRTHDEASNEEFPLFDPSDYMVFSGYPHHRRVQAPRDYWFLHPGGARRSNCSSRRGWCESPIYEIRSDS